MTIINKKISFHTSKKVAASNSQRKAETRTKIQLGGLLIKSGLTDLFSIQVGSDLQLDIAEREKAARLLGALIEMSHNVSVLGVQKENWELLGRSILADGKRV